MIIGGGVAGTSSAVALWRAGVRNILLLERGEIGNGDRAAIGTHTHARRSGSAVMDAPSVAQRIKMIVNLFAASTSLFAAHHGELGVRRYLRAARRGIDLQLRLARDVGADALQLGSLYVAQTHDDVAALEREFQALRDAGADGIALWSAEQVLDATGAKFPRAIFFPHDAIIDSAQYSRLLLQHAAPGVRVVEHCSPVVDVRDCDDGGALTVLADGTIYRSEHALVATGGLFVPPALAGILTPCYSYLVALKQVEPAQLRENTPNIFTWGFTHDLCMTRGWMRVSGADHFSALKPPHDAERCDELAKWTCDWWRGALTSEGSQTQYGVYSETPDRVPLVGALRAGSSVHYLVGCQAWGQAILSALAATIPAVMGITPFASAEEEDEHKHLFAASRFSVKRN